MSASKSKTDRAPFSWPYVPRTDAEFDAMMSAIDMHLASEKLVPFQRPLHVARLFWDAFQWEGPVLPPKELADKPGFEGPVLMAKSHRWYERVYGDKLKSDWAIGYGAYRFAGGLWKVRFPVAYGTWTLFADRNLANDGNTMGTSQQAATFNVLRSVEDLPSGLAERLDDREVQEFVIFFVSSYQALNWQYTYLNGHELFEQAVKDYAASVDDILTHRYAQSRWSSEQAVEKVLKGILALTNVPYPTKGPAGHGLVALSEILEKAHGVSLPRTLLTLVECSPAVRYGEEASSEQQALSASHAVLAVIEGLMKSRVESILTRVRASP